MMSLSYVTQRKFDPHKVKGNRTGLDSADFDLSLEFNYNRSIYLDAQIPKCSVGVSCSGLHEDFLQSFKVTIGRKFHFAVVFV